MPDSQLATASSSALAPHSKKTFEELVHSDRFKAQIAAALPRHLTPERFTRVLLTATLKNPQLLECTQESMFKSIFDAAAAGLEIDGRRAHLVPLRNRKKPGQPLEANLWLDYKGIAELVMRSGVVSHIHADVVCENDVFEYDRGELKAHKIDFRKPRGEMYAVYCIIRMKDGGEKVEVMGKEDVERVRAVSMGRNSEAWQNSYFEMAKKTVFRRASKWVPLSPETRDVVENEDDAIDVPVSAAPSAPVPELAAPADRPPPPPRKPRGAKAALAAQPAEEPKVAEPVAPEQPAEQAAPSDEIPGDPPAKRTSLEDKEVVEGTFTLDTPVVHAHKGADGVQKHYVACVVNNERFENLRIYDWNGAPDGVLKPCYVPGGSVKLTLLGKKQGAAGFVAAMVQEVA